MYEMNGYVYAGNPKKIPRIIHAEARENHVIVAQFNDGEIRSYDCAELLDLPIFSPLKDEQTFMQMTLFYGAPTWFDGDIDIAPELIYDNGEVLPEWPEILPA